MKKLHAIAMSFGVCFLAIAGALLVWAFNVERQSVRYKVKSLTSVPSEASLVDLLGSPDAITGATPDIDGLSMTYCLVYNGPEVLRILRSKKFPFFKAFRPKAKIAVHILGKDKLDHIDHINNNLYWGPIGFHRAVVVLEHESSPNPRDRREDMLVHYEQRKSKQNKGIQVDAAARRD